jgi:hypothetical protein
VRTLRILRWNFSVPEIVLLAIVAARRVLFVAAFATFLALFAAWLICPIAVPEIVP